MKTFLRLFSSKPTPSISALLTFLQQCQASGGRIIFSPSGINEYTRKSELDALLKPLNLPRRDKKTLINDHLIPLTKLTIDPDDIYAAIEHPNQQPFPNQVCDNCAPGLFEHYGYLVADNGWCSQCHGRGECLDIALIEHYRKCGIDDETINGELPRKRWVSRNVSFSGMYQSIEDIEKTYQSVFEAAQANVSKEHSA